MNKVDTNLKFVNTQLFCEAATHFMKFNCYTFAPPGTYEYQEYWDEQDRRCKEGYTVGGVRITGEHYAYLNFGRIKVTIGEGKKQRKYESFPRFLDMDYYYYHELEKAKENMEGMIVAKSRRKGFSYKGAFNLVYEYNWYRDSFNIISAFMSDYSQSTMNMALDMINFLNKHTDWAKRKLIDTRQHIKAGFKEKGENGIEIEQGYKSEILTMSFKDNPFKSIGKSASCMLFEEAGKWPGLIEAYMLSKPLFSDGDIMIGIPIIYGTGGDMEGGTQDFASMFYSPSSYGLRSYENIWDENAVGECGWFVDDSWYKMPHVDEDGNSDRKKALEELDLRRELTRKSGNKRAYQTFITQHPRTPQEAFLRTTGNTFPVADLLERLSYLETHQDIQDADYIVDLISDTDGTIKWKVNPDNFPIKKFPLKQSNEDLTGSVVLFELPQYGNDGQIIFGRYVAGIDPYQQDQAENSSSLGSIFIFDTITQRIVAEYTGRPATARDFYEICRKLIMLYNAKALYENQIVGLFDYFQFQGCVHLLADKPKFIDDIIKHSSVSRKKGMHMAPQLREYGEELIKMWLIGPSTEDGISNLYTIRSIPLLQELIHYDPDPKKNFDRVISLMMCLYFTADKKKIKAKLTEDEDIVYNDFLNSNFFKGKNRDQQNIRHTIKPSGPFFFGSAI